MNGAVTLTTAQVAAAYGFSAVVFWILRRRGIRRERELLMAMVRMTLQLVLTGYVLIMIFDLSHPLMTIAVMLIMVGFAIRTVFKKFESQLFEALKKVIAVGMATGTLVCLIYFLVVVVRVRPWYDPQYFIPIAGMLIGNSMTGISLGIHTLLQGMSGDSDKVEEALLLGATPEAAVSPLINKAFEAAIMPTLQSMLGMGIVFLPGMMTGQILSGTVPTTAIAYQIAIMLGILGAVSLTVIFVLTYGSRTFFNDQAQKIDHRP